MDSGEYYLNTCFAAFEYEFNKANVYVYVNVNVKL